MMKKSLSDNREKSASSNESLTFSEKELEEKKTSIPEGKN